MIRDYKSIPNINYSQHNISSPKDFTKLADCKDNCNSDNNCIGIVWSTKSGGICSLKNSSPSLNNLVYDEDSTFYLKGKNSNYMWLWVILAIIFIFVFVYLCRGDHIRN